MTDNSEPGRRDFLNSEDPQDPIGDEPEAQPRRSVRPEQDEAQLSAALGKAIDQIWSELDGLQRDREVGGRAAVRLPQADVPSFLRGERAREPRRDRPADFTPGPRQRRPRRLADEEVFGRENRETKESTRPPWRADAPVKNRLPALPQFDDLEVEEVRKRQGGPIVAGVLVAFMLAGGVLVVATNVWSLRDSVLGLTPDDGPETVAAATTSEVADPTPEPVDPVPVEKTAAVPPAADPVPPPQLVEKKINGTAGAELKLGLPVPTGADAAEIRIEGLPPSARLSAGREVAPGEWSVAGNDLGTLSVKTPPEAFGAFEVTASLERETGEKHPMGHIWLVLASPPAPVTSPTLTSEPGSQKAIAPAPETPVAPPVAVAPPPADPAPAEQAPPAETASAEPEEAPRAAVQPQDLPTAEQLAVLPPSTSESAPRGLPSRPPPKLSTQEIQDLLTRGTKFFGEGNMAPARLLFRRAADAGEPLGLLLLGMTYDPVEYERRGVVGLSADEVQAMDYYEKARAAGVKDAVQRITALNNWNR